MTDADIRRELCILEELYSVTMQQRNLVALDAVDDEAAAARWTHLDDTSRHVAKRMEILNAALPTAEACAATAARHAEEQARAKRLQDFGRRTEEAQKFVDSVLGCLPTGEALTKARDLRDALRADAMELRTWSNDVHVRRPLDPLDIIHEALVLRVRGVERNRWKGARAFTFGDKAS